MGAVLISRSQPKILRKIQKKIAEIYLRYLPLFACMVSSQAKMFKASQHGIDMDIGCGRSFFTLLQVFSLPLPLKAYEGVEAVRGSTPEGFTR